MAERFTEKFKDGRNILRNGIADVFYIGFGRFFEGEAIDKLAEYENAENGGRIVVLSCKIGDTLFCFSRGKIYPFKVRCIRIYEERNEIEIWYAGDEENLKFWHVTIMEQDIGYKFFFTEEEAEKALKEMEGKL